jgi:hypothetical protein
VVGGGGGGGGGSEYSDYGECDVSTEYGECDVSIEYAECDVSTEYAECDVYNNVYLLNRWKRGRCSVDTGSRKRRSTFRFDHMPGGGEINKGEGRGQ